MNDNMSRLMMMDFERGNGVTSSKDSRIYWKRKSF